MSTEQEAPPLPVGLTLDRGFALLRRHPRSLLLPQLVLNIVPLLFALVLVLIGFLALGDIETRTELARESTFLGDSELVNREVWVLTDGQTATLIVLGVLAAVVYVWFLIAAYVSVVRAADRALEGRDHLGLRPAMRDALAATPKLFGIGVVFSILATLALLAVVIVVALAAVAAGAVAVLVGLAGFVVLVWAGVRVFLWPFVHLSEGAGLASFGRAWRLTRGRFWALFGVVLLVMIVVSVVYFVVSLVLQLVVFGAAALSDEAGVVALIPYVVFSAIFAVVFTAALIGPLAVAYRTLSGRDTADLWQAAQQMGPGAQAAPAPEPGVRRWDASEEPIDPPAPGWSGSTGARPSDDRPPSGDDPARGAGGLPDPSAPSDAERQWGRGGDPPAS